MSAGWDQWARAAWGHLGALLGHLRGVAGRLAAVFDRLEARAAARGAGPRRPHENMSPHRGEI
eukprot:1727596-Pyramimonas_sp.AAC.1